MIFSLWGKRRRKRLLRRARRRGWNGNSGTYAHQNIITRRITYVGRSNNFERREGEHRRTGKLRFWERMLPLSHKQSDEVKYIHKFNPPENKRNKRS